jgi:hypothetical protein
VLGPLILLALAAALLLALRHGGEPEQLMAGLLLATDALDHVQHMIFGPATFVHVDPGHVMLDSITLVGALWIAMRANRFWPLPVCSLQLIILSGHFAILAPIPGLNQAYWALSTVPGWLQIALVVSGVVAHAQRSAKIGPYRDWRWGLSAFSGKLVYPSRPLSST